MNEVLTFPSSWHEVEMNDGKRLPKTDGIDIHEAHKKRTDRTPVLQLILHSMVMLKDLFMQTHIH